MKTSYKDLLLKRINKLTDFEKEWMLENNHGWYNKYLLDYDYAQESYSDSMWESMWCFSAFGQCHLRNQSLAKKFLSSEKKMNYVMDMMEDRKTWYTTKVHIIKNLHTTGKLTQNIMSFIISHMRKHNFNIFESYVNEPIFDTGGIVQFRSNIGVDALVVENKWGSNKQHTQYYGATGSELKQIKNKTMMVLGESPHWTQSVMQTLIPTKRNKVAHVYIVFFLSETQKSILL